MQWPQNKLSSRPQIVIRRHRGSLVENRTSGTQKAYGGSKGLVRLIWAHWYFSVQSDPILLLVLKPLCYISLRLLLNQYKNTLFDKDSSIQICTFENRWSKSVKLNNLMKAYNWTVNSSVPGCTFLVLPTFTVKFWKLSSDITIINKNIISLKNLTCIFYSQVLYTNICNYSIIEIHETWLLPYLLCIKKMN